MRSTLVIVHRWAGLVTAAFLFVAGLTGGIISWDHELDEWLNPHLHHATPSGTLRSAIDLAAEIEHRDPRARVIHMFMAPDEPGASLSFFIQPRVDPATGQRYRLGYNQVFLDPVTGEERGRRQWGAVWPLTRETAVSFLYKLHYTLHIPPFWGSDRWGVRFLGIVAIIWTIDCFVGFILTLPQRRRAGADHRVAAPSQKKSFWSRWRPAWMIKTSGSTYRINFDLHRAFSLWTWSVLLVIAFTAFSLNLYREVFAPILRTVSSYTPSAFELRTPTPLDKPIEPTMSYADILARAEADGRQKGWREPVGVLFYAPQHGVYSASFFHPGEAHGAGGVGPARLYYDGTDGRPLGGRLPWQGTAADIFAQAQFPVHSGRILGLPGRIMISIMGLVVAMLSVTGVLIWWRKRFPTRRKAKLGVKVLSAEEIRLPAA
jgi:uncharacterized iron-regulated membrane protein